MWKVSTGTCLRRFNQAHMQVRYSAVLCCTVLSYALLCYDLLCCIVVCCELLHCIVLRRALLYSAVLYAHISSAVHDIVFSSFLCFLRNCRFEQSIFLSYHIILYNIKTFFIIIHKISSFPLRAVFNASSRASLRYLSQEMELSYSLPLLIILHAYTA